MEQKRIEIHQHKQGSCCCLRSCLVIAIILLLLVTPLGRMLLRFGGNWLDVTQEKLPRADLIYVFAGGENERPQFAAQLFRNKLAPRIMTASGVRSAKLLAIGRKDTEADINGLILEQNGVPATRIVKVPHGSSTWDEANLLLRYTRRHKVRSIILVTSNYHTRRVRMTVKKAFRNNRGIKLYVTSPQINPETDLDRWWKGEHDLITVNNEYVKYFYYVTHYIIRSNPKWSGPYDKQTGG